MTYSLNNARDMLAKLDREIIRLESAIAKPNNQKEISDFAINSFLTAWHICDWHLADNSENDDEAWEFLRSQHGIFDPRFPNGKTIENPLTALQLILIGRCQELRDCQVIANASKHARIEFEPLKTIARDYSQPLSATDTVATPETTIVVVEPHRHAQFGGYNTPEPEVFVSTGPEYVTPKIVVKGDRKRAVEVLHKVRSFWKKELERTESA